MGYRYPNIRTRIGILESLFPPEMREVSDLDTLKRKVDDLEKLISTLLSAVQGDEE